MHDRRFAVIKTKLSNKARANIAGCSSPINSVGNLTTLAPIAIDSESGQVYYARPTRGGKTGWLQVDACNGRP